MATQKLINIVSHFEGCQLKAYPDPATHAEPWTIGFGSTVMEGVKVHPGLTITMEQARAQQIHDLDAFQSKVKAMIRVKVNQDQLDALTSFAYNVGIGNFQKSNLLTLLNGNHLDSIPEELMKWNKANHKVMTGLTLRRAAEGHLFATGEVHF